MPAAPRIGRAGHDPFERAETRVTAFLGRTEDLEAVADLYARGARLVTLIGPPGVGKTRLALRFGSLHLAEFPGGAWFLDLSEARTALDVVGIAAAALGLALASSQSLALAFVQTARALAARGTVLVVLDNAEHIPAEVAALIAAWQNEAPAARLLVTSREPLRLGDELRYAVEPLDVATAVSLFEARAKSFSPRFSASVTDREVVIDIVERLDRLPLAVELAAARAAVLSPTALLEQLGRRFELLHREARDVPERKTSLRAALEWSWNLLEPWEADALDQCALFAGGFTAEAAEAVVALAPGAPRVIDALQSLHEKSLLCRGPRFRLYESVRELALERLSLSPEKAAGEARHAKYYGALADAWVQGVDGPEAERCLAAFHIEIDNMSAAHARAIASEPALSANIAVSLDRAIGHVRAPTSRIPLLDGAVRAAQAAGDPALHALALSARGGAFCAAGRWSEAFADACAARDVAHASAESNAEADAERLLAELATYQNHFDEAHDHVSKALDLLGGEDRGTSLARVLTVRGGIEIGMRRFTGARASLERALAIQRQEGNLRGEARALAVLGELSEQEHGSVERTMALRERALGGYRRIGDRPAQALSLVNLSYCCLELGQWERAQGFSEGALALARPFGLPWLEAIASVTLATSLAMQGRWEDASELSRRALVLSRDTGHYAEALVWMNLAVMESLRGDIEAAGSALEAAEGSVRLASNPALSEVLAVSRGFQEIALAGAAAQRDDGASATGHIDRARLLAEPRTGPAGPEPSDVRVVRRLLAITLEERAPPIEARIGASPGGGGAALPLVVHPEGRWFQPPGGERVACAGRPVLRRVLVALAEARIQRPGIAMSPKELLAAGWPGERIGPAAARRRLQVMMWRLRELGLRRFLRADPDGYLLDPDVRVDVASTPDRM